jgi:hypothetical protein
MPYFTLYTYNFLVKSGIRPYNGYQKSYLIYLQPYNKTAYKFTYLHYQKSSPSYNLQEIATGRTSTGRVENSECRANL